MKAYIARIKADESHPGEIVGFFVAHDLEHLSRLVDECCDADCCEVMELGPGGIFWHGRVDYVVPVEPSETVPGLPSGGTMTEGWFSSLYDEDQWEPLIPGFNHANDA